MFPIGDDNSSRRTVPVVTYALIALNLILFIAELNGGDAFIQQWAFVPRRFLANPGGDFPTLSMNDLIAATILVSSAGRSTSGFEYCGRRLR